MEKWKILLLITCMFIIVATITLFVVIPKLEINSSDKLGSSLSETLRNKVFIEGLRDTSSSQNKTINGTIITKNYNATDKSVKITDNESNILIDIQLISPYVVSGLIASPDTKVAEFYLEDWKDEKVSLVESMEFFDTNEEYDKIADRNFRFKWENVTTRCVKENASAEICFDESEWIEFEFLDELPKEEVTIGLFADIKALEQIEWVPTIKGFEILEWAAWNVSDASHVQTYVVNSVQPGALSFSTDGSKMYVGDFIPGTIYEYDLSEPWNVTSASYNDKNVSTSVNYVEAIEFKPDGKQVYFTQATSGLVHQFSLTSAWDITTASANTTFDPSVSISGQALAFKSDGTKMYTGYYDIDNIHEWTLSTAWDIDSASDASSPLDISGLVAGNTNPQGLFMGANDLILYVVLNTPDEIYQYILSSAGDISTGVLSNSNYSLAGETGGANGVHFKPDGSKFYITGNNPDTAIEYNITVLLDAAPPSVTKNTPLNESYATTTIEFNVTATDDISGMSNCSYTLDGGTNNFTMANLSTSPTYWTATNTTMAQDSHTVNFYCRDVLNKLNNSEETTFLIDIIYPDIEIVYPTNLTDWSDVNLDVNFTRSDVNLDSCWYSNDTYNANATLASCGNVTTVIWSQGLHNVTVWTNDSANNLNSSRITFTIDTINPSINITYPINNTNWSNVNLDINFTRGDLNLESCWYSNDTYNVNSTPDTSCANVTSIVWSEGQHNVTVWANDSFGNLNSSKISFTIDTTAPVVAVSTPSPTYFLYGNNYTFNWSITETNLDTCWYSFNSTNTTVTCADNNSSINITNYNPNSLTMWANDSAGTKTSLISSWSYDVFVYSNTYNATTYATESQTFTFNMSSDGTQSISADLIYGGVNRGTGTKVGNNLNMIISKAIDIPDITSPGNFHWNVTYGASIINTTNLSQVISPINLSSCIGDNNVTYINFTFVDEETLTSLNASIDASTWNYRLGTSTENSTYTYSNTAPAFNWPFCFDPGDKPLTTDLIFKYSNTTYPQRTYAVNDLSLSNTTTQQTLYLLGTADGIYSSIMIINPSGSPIEGVAVTAERQISGSWVTIGQANSGSDGAVTFWVNPDYPHRFTAVKIGYLTAQVNIQPSQSLYTLTMQSTSATASYTSEFDEVTWIWNPSAGTIPNGTLSFNVSVTGNLNLENCKFEILNATNTSQVLATGTSLTNSSYCFINHILTVYPGWNLFGRLSIDTTNTTGYIILDSDNPWTVEGTRYFPRWRHVSGFFGDLTDMTEFGEGNEGNFSRFMFFFILASLCMGVFFFFTDMNMENHIYPVIIVYTLTLIASIGGFFTINLGADIENITLIEKYGLQILFTMVAASLWIKEYRKGVDTV